jgi:ribose/xylose/arabinose/galactoside ABC-type transport system permease subunit
MTYGGMPTAAGVKRRLANASVFMLGVNLVSLAVFTIALPHFGSTANLQAILVSSLPLLLLATGQTFVLVSGGIDLSAPALVGLASVGGALVMSGDVGWLATQPAAVPAGLMAMVAVGTAAGMLNGVSVARLRMPAFMVTLTMAMFAGGLAVWATQTVARTETVYNLPDAFLAIGRHGWIHVPLALAATLAAHGLLTRTLVGRWLHALGHNLRAAHISGVPTGRVITLAYATSGLFAGLAALLITARLETASPTHGRQLLLDVIGAAVIGGTSLAGGIGSVAGTASGVLFLSILSNGLTLLNLSDFAITIVKGLVILSAALLDQWRRRWTTSQAHAGDGAPA